MIVEVRYIAPDDSRPWTRATLIASVGSRQLVAQRHIGVKYEDDVLIAARLLVERLVPMTMGMNASDLPARIVAGDKYLDWCQVQVEIPTKPRRRACTEDI